MALLDFPPGPSLGQSTTQNGNTWKWNGTSWVAFNNVSLTSQVTGILAVDYGGTGFGGTYTAGDILYALSSNTFGKLNAGTAGSVLASGGPSTAPYWKKDDAGTGSVSAGTLGGFAYYDTTNSITSGTAVSYIIGSGAGGTGATFVIKQSTMALIGSTITAGTWAGSAITAKYGGTGLNALSAGDIIYGSATDTYSRLSFPGAGYALTTVGAGTSVVWQTLSTMNVGSATTATNAGFAGAATTATSAGSAGTAVNAGFAGAATTAVNAGLAGLASNLSGGTQGALHYQSATNTSGFISYPGAGYALTSVGSGTSAVWQTLSTINVGSATTATNAGFAGAATTATNAGFAGAATTATNAGFAGAATTATSAGSAGTSVNAGFAGAATTAVNAGFAGAATTATSAGSAGTSVNAGFAGAATTATTAGSAGTAVNSGSAGLASNLSGGTQGALHYQSATNTSGFISYPGAGYALTSVGAGTSSVWAPLTTIAVTSVSAGTAIQVSQNTGAVTITNNGVHSVSGTTNRVNVSSGSGGTGAVTLTLPNTVVVNEIQVDGPSSTLSTVGSQPTSMVNKQYVDNLASGLDIHDSVRLVITSAIGASYYQPGYGIGNTATGAYLTSIGNSTFPEFDGVTIGTTGVLQRVLITGGLTATGKTSINGSALVSPATLAASYLVNGIYYLGSAGSGSSQWYLYRAAETDDNTELTGGTFTFVEEGILFKDTGWVCTNDTTNLGPIQFGSTAISFSQFTGAAAISFGQGITKVGNTVATNVNLSATGAAAAIGYTQFNIGGPTVGGAADTGYYPTFSVRTGTIHAGTSLLTLNHTGFSLTGSTNTPATLTISGNVNHTGAITIPNPGGIGRIPYSSDSDTLSFLNHPGAGYALTSVGTNSVVWQTLSTMNVGSATTATNAGFAGAATTATSAGSAGTSVNAGFAGAATTAVNAGFAGAATTATSAGSAGTSVNAGFAGAATTAVNAGFAGAATTATSAGSAGTSVNAGFAGAATTAVNAGLAGLASNLSGGTQGALHYQSATNTSGFISYPGAGYALTSVGSGTSAVWQTLSTINVGSATTAVNAGFAGAATTAVNAGFAGAATTAVNAGFAGAATTATSAGSAGTSVNAGFAGAATTATSAGSAGTSVNAGFAGAATTAVNAGFAGAATTATSAGTAYTSALISINSSTVTRYIVGTALNSASAGGTTLSTGSGITIGDNLLTSTSITVSGSTASTSTSTGALLVAGGVGVGGSLWTSALNFSSVSGLGISNGAVLSGTWTGTAITTGRGGTGLITVSPNQILMGASTGNTWAAVGSSVVPVVAIGAAAPAQPGGAIGATQAGQLWWDSEYGVLKVYYVDATPTAQWVDATPVLGSSGGGSSTKRSYVMTFGAGFTPSTGADTVQIHVPYAPDNASKYYFIKRLDYRNETDSSGAGVSFFIERFTGGNAAFTSPSRIHTAGSGAGSSFKAAGAGIFITSYTLSSTGASFVSSSGVAGSVISGDYLRLNFSNIGGAATMSVSIVLEEQ